MTARPRPWPLVLALLVAFVVPRGVTLGWCLCDGPEAGCCSAPAEPAGCCGGSDGADEGSGEQLVSAEECGCCGSYELDEAQESTPPEGGVTHPAPVQLAAASGPPAHVPTPRRGMVPARDPPRVTPPGLRPGARPLRL